MATWQTNTVGGLHPITQSIMSLAGAMFDPEIDRQRELRQSQIAVYNAQIGNYNANASKLASDTALNNQVLGARNNAANAFRLAAGGGKVTPEHAALLYENLIQGGGASGGDVSQLGDTLGAIMLMQNAGDPNYVQDATTGMMLKGHMPDLNFAPTPGRADAISARDASEALRQATTVQGMADAAAMDRKRLEESGLDRRATVNAGAGDTVYTAPGGLWGGEVLSGAPTMDTTKAAAASGAIPMTDTLSAILMPPIEVSQGAGLFDNQGNPLGKPNLSPKDQIVQNLNDTGYTLDPSQSLGENTVAAAVLGGDTAISGSNPIATKAKNWYGPNGAQGITFDGRTDSITGNPLPAGSRLGTDFNPLAENKSGGVAKNWRDPQTNASGITFDGKTDSATGQPLPPNAMLSQRVDAEPNAPIIASPQQIETLSGLAELMFGQYDDVPDALSSAIQTRASELFQKGDMQTGLAPGNMQTAINQAFAELATTVDDGWGAPDLALRNGAPAAPAVSAPAVSVPQSGQGAVDSVTQEALSAIAQGADPKAVAARYKQVTGKDLVIPQ
jgi:hypothetical protein